MSEINVPNKDELISEVLKEVEGDGITSDDLEPDSMIEVVQRERLKMIQRIGTAKVFMSDLKLLEDAANTSIAIKKMTEDGRDLNQYRDMAVGVVEALGSLKRNPFYGTGDEEGEVPMVVIPPLEDMVTDETKIGDTELEHSAIVD